MAEYYVQLTIETPEPMRFYGRDVFRIRIAASDGYNMPDEIFLHKKTVVNPETSYEADEFIAVCGPWDLATYPVDEPEETQDPPFFRKASFDILVPGVEDASTVISSVKSQVAFLTSLLSKLDDLSVVESCWIPGNPYVTTTTPAP